MAWQMAPTYIGVAFGQGTTTPSAGSAAATGQVVGPNSKPQAGIPVVVVGPQGKTHAFTDAKGSWSLYNLKPGTYSVQPTEGMKAGSDQSVSFTVKEKGLFEKLFGSNNTTVYASELKLPKDFQQ
jgi:hypothetical protein